MQHCQYLYFKKEKKFTYTLFRERQKQKRQGLCLSGWTFELLCHHIESKKERQHFEVGWQNPLDPRLLDVLHPGKLRLREGRWNSAEPNSASSHGISSCRASLDLGLSLHVYSCMCYSHTVIDICTRRLEHTCTLSTLYLHVYSANTCIQNISHY